MNIPITNLIQGVSQQPRANRLPSQCERMDNCYPSVVDGLQKRFPTRHLAKAIDGDAGDLRMHVINRDTSERYVLVMRDEDLAVFGTDGTEYGVFGPTGPAYTPDFSYLATSDVSSLRALTVNDYTFIVNSQVPTQMGAATTAADPSPNKAFLFVRQSNYKVDYTVKLQRSGGDVETVSTSTWDGTAAGTVKEIRRVIITSPGTAGGTWNLQVLGVTVNYTVLLGDTNEIVAFKLAQALNASSTIAASAFANGAQIQITADLPGVALTAHSVTPPAGGAASTAVIVAAATTESQSIKTNDVAQRLSAKINELSGFTADVLGSVIRITSSTALTLFDCTDSLSDRGLVRVWKQVAVQADLPVLCEDGYTIKVTGGDGAEDDYYVAFDADVSGQFGAGRWVESRGFGIDYELDADTMPWRLVRKQDDPGGTVTGTPNAIFFEWSQNEWEDRLVGDDTTNPPPSFVGLPISDLFFFRNRLGFLAADHVVLSESPVYFNFWRTTVLSLPDSDPIDLNAAHTKVANLHAAVTLDQRLVLFSDQTQFVLSGEPLLTPATAAIVPVLEYENQRTTRPVATARGVFFPQTLGSFSGMLELFPVDDASRFDTDPLTAHAPRYIVGEVTDLAASSLQNLLCALADGDETIIYAYNFHWAGQEKLQSAWNRYVFNAPVRGIGFIENSLYLLIQRDEGLFLEVMDISAGQADDNATYVTYLDRRIEDGDVTMSYDLPSNRTTITLPYDIEPDVDMQVVTRSTVPNNGGAVLEVLSAAGDEIEVRGDITLADLWIGQAYEQVFEFSEITLKEQTERGRALIASGRLQLVNGTLAYDNSAYFRVEVTPIGRDPYVMEFGPTLGVAQTVLDEVTFDSGTFQFGVQCLAQDVTIAIKNASPLPGNIQTAEFKARYFDRSTRFSG